MFLKLDRRERKNRFLKRKIYFRQKCIDQNCPAGTNEFFWLPPNLRAKVSMLRKCKFCHIGLWRNFKTCFVSFFACQKFNVSTIVNGVEYYANIFSCLTKKSEICVCKIFRFFFNLDVVVHFCQMTYRCGSISFFLPFLPQNVQANFKKGKNTRKM